MGQEVPCSGCYSGSSLGPFQELSKGRNRRSSCERGLRSTQEHFWLRGHGGQSSATLGTPFPGRSKTTVPNSSKLSSLSIKYLPARLVGWKLMASSSQQGRILP